MADEPTPNETEPTPVTEQPETTTPQAPQSPPESPFPVVTPESSMPTGATPGGAHNGLAIAGMIVGIIAVISGWVPFWGILAGAAAVILSIIALKKHEGKGFAITGIITGGIAVLTSFVTTGLFIWALAAAPGIVSSEQQAEKKAAAQETASVESPAKTDIKKDFAKGETATFDVYQVKVNSVKTGYTASDGYSTPDDGDQFIEVNMTVKNIDKSSQPIDSSLFGVLDNGVEKDASYVSGDSPLSDGELPAGASTTGDVVYEVSTNASGLKLEYDTYDSNLDPISYTLAM